MKLQIVTLFGQFVNTSASELHVTSGRFAYMLPETGQIWGKENNIESIIITPYLTNHANQVLSSVPFFIVQLLRVDIEIPKIKIYSRSFHSPTTSYLCRKTVLVYRSRLIIKYTEQSKTNCGCFCRKGWDLSVCVGNKLAIGILTKMQSCPIAYLYIFQAIFVHALGFATAYRKQRRKNKHYSIFFVYQNIICTYYPPCLWATPVVSRIQFPLTFCAECFSACGHGNLVDLVMSILYFTRQPFSFPVGANY